MTQPKIYPDQIAIATGLDAVLVSRATLDFGSLGSNGGEATLTHTVTGAAVGDGVAVLPTQNIGSGIIVQGWVSSADTVTVKATNVTPGAVDPASQDFVVLVFQVS